MSSQSGIAEIINGIGPLDGDIVTVIEAPDVTWIVSYEDCDVELDYDEATRTLSLATPLGVAAAERLPAVCTTLLKYNAIRRETGGIVMTMMPDERLVQTLDLVDPRFTADGCVEILRNFVTKARIWRGYVAREDEAPAIEDSAGDLMATAIRI